MYPSNFIILLLDDSPEDRAIYRRFLQKDSDYSYTIVEADCAKFALEYCRTSPPDLVLMDYLLPDMDGLEFLEQLQQFISIRTLPILMMTGQGNETVAVQALKMGIQDYLIKNQITSDNFCPKIHQALERVFLIQQIQQQQEQQQLVANVALRIRQFLNLNDILITAVAEVRHCVKADRVVVYQFLPSGGGQIRAESVLPPWLPCADLSLDHDFFSEEQKNAYRHRQQSAITNIYQVGLSDRHVQFLESWNIKSSLITPILLAEGNPTIPPGEVSLWGLLIVHQCADFRAWTEAELNLLQGIGVHLEIAILHGELYEQAQKELQQRRQIEAELRSLNQELEERVKGRTVALQLTNDRLQQEISVRRIAETLLRTSQLRFHKLADHIPGVIFQYLLQPNGEGIFTYVSLGCRNLLELEPEELLKNSGLIKTLIHPDDLEALQWSFRTATTRLDQWNREFRIRMASGEIKWIRGTARLERQNNRNIVYEGLLVDISDRKGIEKALQQQIEGEQLLNTVTQRLRGSLNLQEVLDTAAREAQKILKSDRIIIYQILENSPGKVIAEICKSGCFCTLNHQIVAENLPPFGHELFPQELISSWVEQYLREESTDLQKLITTHQTQSKLVVPIVQNNQLWGVLIANDCFQPRQWQPWEIHLLEKLASQLAIAIQQSQLYQKLQIELQERQEADLQLQATNQQLQLTNQALAQATRLKDEFLANMSHELRTPLNAILGMSEGLLEEVYGFLTEKQRKSLLTIQRSGQHLLELINDILDLAKIESGQVKLELSPTSLHSLCNHSLTFIQSQAQKKNLQLIIELPPQDCLIWVDQRRIRQVLINLLSNAVKFTSEGGKIILRAKIEANRLTTDTSLDVQVLDQLILEVEDTGMGISLSDQEKLFQSFVQLDNRLSRSHAGTGLGLALVRRITELHEGVVTVDSIVGQGSCFRVSLPYKASALTQRNVSEVRTMEDSETVKSSKPVSKANFPLILLAEDNQLNTTMLSEYLDCKGYQVVLAENGLDVLKITKEQRPHLILMDISMPQMDGLTAMRQIRANSSISKIPIIALTALAMPEDEERCLAMGANVYLAKPIRLVQLLETIQTLLSQSCQRS